MRRIPLLAALFILVSTAAAAYPIGSVLAPPQARISGGSFSLRTRIVDGGTNPRAWSCRLYFDTDLNSSTGWFPSRGYEYVACPAITRGSQMPVARTLVQTADGMGGPFCGYGSGQVADRTLSLSVPLSVLRPSNGRLAWELMVFDAHGTWIGSYGGRFAQ